MKLGKRLQQIKTMIPRGYDHIWDTCCDHGLLGAALLQNDVAPNIHFVDIVPELIAELEAKLHKFSAKLIPADSALRWHTHCINTNALPLNAYSGKHLVIIAGVGGDLTQEIVTAIVPHHAGAKIDFLLCPVHHEYALRQQLIQLECHLLDETLVEENQRIYEILYISTNARAVKVPIQPVGSLLWQANKPEAVLVRKQYLKTRIQHYQRQTRNNHLAKEALAAYQRVIL
ncbi:SAM-dependent methyltransferase [Aliidiomarina shirensis]|uniref:SAM-dependent methyltransferase n=1 Tax=Aliidiomarina shirensis TaxID=1048642 RepID=A0A432WWN5_9GAMM|nr:tRNA (adenine(22)-N(1))-methyltransferase TrmK [Aliidiomarina shirensis]RUO38186.1 SAM-dependent methyltransferase [Aliidiomarina shirensis]